MLRPRPNGPASRRRVWHGPSRPRSKRSTRLRFELGETVRERRADLGLSQSELGRRAGMTQSAVARFEGGGTVPTIPVLDRLARALDLDLRVELTPHADSA
ncbi:helix-turn-helix transcriptional regulator [Streptomyces cuspidosporus]|uniref:helix-turn-helix domain-containing protein n=1 Tax=Streptomyces cuspidosporus TaxID=66882 RepID=UPI0031FBDF7E